MASIGEQIVAARKAKGMTQDALAKALHLSRQAVSHWETGRTLPDAEMLIRLSQLLDYNFEGGMATASGPESITESITESAPAERESGKKRSKRRWIIACAAALAVIACALAVALPRLGRKVEYEVEGTPGEVVPISYYAQAVPNEPDKAFLEIQSTASIVDNGGTAYQMYDFQLVERNGIGFNIEYILYFDYSDAGKVYRGLFTAQDFRSFGLEPNMPPYGTMPFNGGFPRGQYDSTGIIIHGTDANGEPLVFHAYLDFHQ